MIDIILTAHRVNIVLGKNMIIFWMTVHNVIILYFILKYIHTLFMRC